MRLLRFLALISLCACLSASSLAAEAAASSGQTAYAIEHVNLIPMDRDQLLRDQTVLVQAGRVSAVGSSRNAQIPSGARRINGKGKYLMPGLTDAHVHLLSPIELPLYLANGVTTVFNLDGRPAHLAWRKQIRDGSLLGPTIMTTGPIFERARSAEEDVRMVDEQAELGYDAVKVYNPVSRAEYPALIAEAKKKNLLLMGHVARGPGFEMTLASGQSIAHLEEFLYTYFNPQHDNNDDHIVLDESKIVPVARQTAGAGIFVTPTLSTYRDIVAQATDLDHYLQNPQFKYLAPWTLSRLQPDANIYKNGFKPADYPRIRASLEFQRKLVKALEDAGVPLMAGTDATDIGPIAGFAVHEELAELNRDGLTPFQTLQTATVNPARYFHQAAEYGTIEAGKRADLLLLSQNPLADIAATRSIEGVMLRGQWLTAAELQRMVQELPGKYRNELEQTEREMISDPLRAETELDATDPFDRLAYAAMADLGPAKLKDVVVRLRERNPKSRLASEPTINNLGYALLARKKFADAVAVLRMNTADFPNSANAFDSLGEALFKAGDAGGAVENYKKAVELDAKYPNADFARKFISEHAASK